MKGEVDTEFTTDYERVLIVEASYEWCYIPRVKQKDLVDVGDDVESDCVESRTAELALD